MVLQMVSKLEVPLLAWQKAKKLGEEMQNLRERDFHPVAVPKPPPSIESRFEKGTKSFESRATVMENVMQALKDDKIHMIGICGMGGVGKTTIAQEVIKRAKEWKLFDKVVMVSVSRTPDVWKIQADIAFFLNLHMPPNAETTDARACWLFERIKEVETVFVILDDIWTKLELNRIGIPLKEDHKGSKILLTSRSQQAVKDTGAESRIFEVRVLNEEEAWSLFKEKAGISEGSIHDDPLGTPRAVANECKGLPLALVVVGGALRDADTDWEDALRQLQHSIVDNIYGVDEQVYRTLKYSYDQLKSEEAKKCFLLCSMYPEDYDIPVEDLVRYGYALKLFRGTKKVGEARKAAYSTVNTLKKCYLLLDSDKHRGEHVKIHDIIRDVALSIASREEDPFMYDDGALEDSSEDEHKRYAVISLQDPGEYKRIGNLVFPKLWLFRLTRDGGLFKIPDEGDGGPLEIPDNFYQGMKKLKVVDLSNIYIQSLPEALGYLSSLHTLSIENCQVNGNMSVVGELENLEILSLKFSRVKELPIEMKKLTRLKLLDLCGCRIEIIPPGVISSLSSLEEIFIGEVGKDLLERVTELSSLSNVMALSIILIDHNLWPRNWKLEKMKNFEIALGLYSHSIGYKLDNALSLRGIDVSAIKESGLRILLKSSKRIYLDWITGLENIFCLGEDNFENLTSLRLESCSSIEYLISATHGDPQSAFPAIEYLRLENLKSLRMICATQPQKGSSNAMTSSFSNSKVVFATLKGIVLSDLPELIGKPLWKYEYDHHQQKQEGRAPIRIDWLSNLTNLRLDYCDKLESVFSAPVARGLMQLENISIASCKIIEAVVVPSEGGDICKAKKATMEEDEEEIMFPKLQKLDLEELPCFSSFCKVRTAIKMPQLKLLELSNVPKMISFCLSPTTTYSDSVIQSFFNKFTFTNLEELELFFMDDAIEIWSTEFLLKLRKLRVWNCPRLLNLLPSDGLQRGMRDLEDVEVKECQSVEVAFNLQGLTTTVEEFGDANLVVALPMLEKLHLLHLPKLIHVWKITSPSSFQGFQKLTYIKIKGCGSLRNLFPTCVAKLLQSLEKLEILECEAMQAIFAVGDPKVDDHGNEGTSSASMVVLLPQLKVLKLIYLPNLRSLCPQDFTFPGTRLEELEVVHCPNIEQHCWRNVKKVEIIPKSTDIRHLDGKVILPCQDGKPIIVRGMDEPTNTWYEKVDEEVQRCLHEANSIWFLSCEKLLSVITSSNLIGRLHYLESLVAWGCNSMEAIFDLIEFDSKEQSVSQLEELKLKYLPKLTHIWKNIPQQSYCYFQGLTNLKVKNCDSLRHVFTVSMVKALVNLQFLIIARCEKVEKIVARDEGGKGEKKEEEEEEEGELFAWECYIILRSLPNLICLGPEEDDSRFLTTENLTVEVTSCCKYRGLRSPRFIYDDDE